MDPGLRRDAGMGLAKSERRSDRVARAIVYRSGVDRKSERHNRSLLLIFGIS